MKYPALQPTQAPQKFGRYEVVDLLGSGAMGRVYLAHDPVLDRKVALKVIAVDPSLNRGNRDEYLARFSVEARASAKLSHPSIVQVFDAGDQNGEPWIAFQFVEGRSLDVLLQEKGRLAPQRAAAIARDIASALQLAHSHNIIHRDIKPANILIEDATGTAKLADFGVVKAPWATMTQAGNTVGSPGYMSPEQIEGTALDQRADLFSLGVVLYEMVSGRHPFLRDTVSATVYATCSGACKPLRQLVPAVPANIEAAVTRCLAPDRTRRIGTASELLAVLAGAGAQRQGALPGAAAARIPAMAPAPRVTIDQLGPPQGDAPSAQPIGREPRAAVWRRRVRHYVTVTATATVTAVAKARPHVAASAQKIGQAAATAAERLSAALKPELRRLIRTRGLHYAMWGSLGGAVFVGLLLLVLTLADAPRMPAAGSREGRLLAACMQALGSRDARLAGSLADSLTALNSALPITHLVIARAMIDGGRYEAAAQEVALARGLKGGAAASRHELTPLLASVGRQFAKGQAPARLLDLAAYTLQGHKSSQLKSWTREPDYWLRWNAIKVLQMRGTKTDLVPAYIMDLNLAGSMSTRIAAAEKLGELGGRRAVEALREARGRGISDPFVALAAKSALEKIGEK